MTGLHLVGLSGGKDSTCMALLLREMYPRREFTYFCTPTGDELPEMIEHWLSLEKLLGQPILRLYAKKNLNGLIDFYNALPNWRQRWCTRQLKIEVAKAFYLKHPDSIVYVGLRADEEARAGGIYGDIVRQVYPLREGGFTEKDVWSFLDARGVTIPRRTDCARCYHQTLGEWWHLWKEYPEIYAEAEAQEKATGHTFRSPSRDLWPASLKGMRELFELGKIPRGTFSRRGTCRACSI